MTNIVKGEDKIVHGNLKLFFRICSPMQITRLESSENELYILVSRSQGNLLFFSSILFNKSK